MRRKNGRIRLAPKFTMVGVLMFGILLSLNLGSNDASAQENPPYQLDATITLFYKDYFPNNESHMEPETAAQVGPGHSGSIQFGGQLILHRFPSTQTKQLVITLEAHLEDVEGTEIIETTPGAWAAAAIPRTHLIFQQEPDRPGGYTIDFNLAVRAPLRIDNRAQKNVVVDCYWRADPATPLASNGVIHSGPLNCGVAPYFEIDMDSENPMETVWPGGAATFKLIIYNRGNSHDEYAIGFENEKFLTENGWVVQLHQTSLDVPAHSQGSFRVTVYSPQKLISTYKSEVMDIPIRVESENAATNNDEEYEVYPVFVHLQGFNCDLWCLPPIIILIVALTYFIRMRKKWRAKRIERLKTRRRDYRDRATGRWRPEVKEPAWYSKEGMRKKDRAEEIKAATKAGHEVEDEVEEAEEAEEADKVEEGTEEGKAEADREVDVESLLKKKPSPEEILVLEHKVDGMLEEKGTEEEGEE